MNEQGQLLRGLRAFVALRRQLGLPDWHRPRHLSRWEREIIALRAFGSFDAWRRVPGDAVAYSNTTFVKAPPKRNRGHASGVAAAMGDFLKTHQRRRSRNRRGAHHA